MINNYSVYQSQLNEWIQEDPDGYNNYVQKSNQKAFDSYPEGKEVIYCTICGAPLVYNSMSYHEGFHFDSCL